MRLATARAVDRLRQRVRRTSREVPGGGGLGIDTVPDRHLHSRPDDRAEQAEMSARLRAALAHLPPKQADAFCLHCLEGWSYREVAEHLETSVDDVGVCIHRARAALKERLAFILSATEATTTGASRITTTNRTTTTCGRGVPMSTTESQPPRHRRAARPSRRALRDEPVPADGPSPAGAGRDAGDAAHVERVPNPIVTGRRSFLERLVAMTFTQRIAAAVMITLGALTLYVMFSLFNVFGPSVAFADVADKLKASADDPVHQHHHAARQARRSIRTLMAEPRPHPHGDAGRHRQHPSRSRRR